MDAISAAELIDAWERALGCGPVERAILLASMGLPERSTSDAGRLPIGRRDLLILSLREATIGPRLAATVECPSCAACLELDFDVSDIRPEPGPGVEEIELSEATFTLRLRLPNSFDQRAAAEQADAATARQALFERCVIAAERAGQPVALADVPEGVVGVAAERLAAADPSADLLLDATCPECRHGWSVPFDIASFFWREIDARATRLLHEVHTLAAAYGWSEREILGIGPIRRQFYLQAVAG
jgi:hypothetical protein